MPGHSVYKNSTIYIVYSSHYTHMSMDHYTFYFWIFDHFSMTLPINISDCDLDVMTMHIFLITCLINGNYKFQIGFCWLELEAIPQTSWANWLNATLLHNTLLQFFSKCNHCQIETWLAILLILSPKKISLSLDRACVPFTKCRAWALLGPDPPPYITN